MPQGLLDLVRSGDLDGLETRCLELLETGEVPLAGLAACFRQMERDGNGDRVPTLAQMVLENMDPAADPEATLQVACAALSAGPTSQELRLITIELYQRVYGQTPGFSAIMASSGLTTGRAARAALRVLDFCLSLEVGDTLISRMDGRVVEVAQVDRQRGLFTLRRGGRATTIPAREVVREYERVAGDDFRVLRQLRPERLSQLIHDDPVALVIGLMHAYGEQINADELKHELVPKYIDSRQWSKWWSKTRTQLKRSTHVVMEGRSPIMLRYSSQGVTLEEEIWAAVEEKKDPAQWLALVEGYLREQKDRKRQPDPALLKRCHDHIAEHGAKVRSWRPAEALACGLVLRRLGQRGMSLSDQAAGLADDILQNADRPAELLAHVTDGVIWERALAELPQARPDDWAACAVALLPVAPASQLDRVAAMARKGQRLDALQLCIDDALADVIDYSELVYWLWRGPKDAAGLKLPPDSELFTTILATLSALGATLTPPPELSRAFRTRMKSALALRGYARLRACLKEVSPEAAVPLRRQIERLEGLGQNARTSMLDILREVHPQLWVMQEQKVAPWEDTAVLWATSQGIDKKTAERDELVNVKMHENAKRIGEAAALGDLSENSEYRFALEERDFLRARLAQINRDLSMARLLTVHDVPVDQVGIGSRVTLRHTADGSQRVMTVLGSFETDVERGIYNYRAPVCQKLMGRKLSERATLTIDGADQEYEVVAIENGLAAEKGDTSILDPGA